MRQIYREIDFEKYHTFFLEYKKDCSTFDSHIIRPCTATYKDIKNKTATTYWLDGALISFDNKTSIPEILIECSLHGIYPDFIDIIVKTEDGKRDRWSDNAEKIAQIIDTHEEDVSKYLEQIEAPKHYVVRNTNKKDVLKFLVVNRFLQDNKIKFLNGEYDKKAVIAGFKRHEEAEKYCRTLNKEDI